MHYVFKSRSDADLLMMQPVAEQLLRILGREPSPRGILEAASIPAAIDALQSAIAEEAATLKRSGAVEVEVEPADGRPEQRIGLAQRAWPLLQMMKRSLADKADIVWGV